MISNIGLSLAQPNKQPAKMTSAALELWIKDTTEVKVVDKDGDQGFMHLNNFLIKVNKTTRVKKIVEVIRQKMQNNVKDVRVIGGNEDYLKNK